MKPMRITDLEKFVEEQIYKPYSNMIDEKVTLKNARQLLIRNKEWSRLVLSRLSHLHIKFPNYIDHGLVRFIKNAVTINWDHPKDYRP